MSNEKKISRKLQAEFGCAYTVALQRVRANVPAAEKLKAETGQPFGECLEKVTREDMAAWRASR